MTSLRPRPRPSTALVLLLAGVLASAVGGTAAGAHAHAAAVRSCAPVGFTPNSDDGAFMIRARNVSCRTARRVARRSRAHGIGRSYRYRAFGFRCRGRYVGDALPHVRYRCTRGDAVVTFDRS